MAVNIKKEMDASGAVQDDPYTISLDKEFQMMLLEILGAIKIAIDTNKAAIDKNKEVIDTTASDVTYLVEKADNNEQDVNDVKNDINNIRSMIVTSSQTLQIISNNMTNALSSQINNNQQQGFNQFNGMGNSNFSLSGQLAALQNQQQQPLAKQLGKYGSLGSSDFANKYMSGQNGNKKKSDNRNNNLNKFNTDIGQRLPSSFQSNNKNNSSLPSSIESRLQQSLGTDPMEQELLKEQQKAKVKIQSKVVRPMVRQTNSQTKEKGNANTEVQDITISDSDDDEKEPTNKKQKNFDNQREKPQRDDSPNKSNNTSYNSIRNRNNEGNESDEDELKARDRDFRRRQDNYTKDYEDSEDRADDRNRKNNSKVVEGLNIPDKYNILKFGCKDQEKDTEKFGSTSLSALKAQLNMQRLGQDNDRERGDMGLLGSLTLGSSLRNSLGKYGLPRLGNDEDTDKTGPLGIGSALRDKYNLSNSDNNIQNNSLGRFMDIGKSSSSLSTNLLGSIRSSNQDSILDRMRSSGLMRDSDRLQDRRENKEQWNRDLSDTRNNREDSQGRDRNVREDRNHNRKSRNDAPDDSDEDQESNRASTYERNIDADEDMEMMRKKDKDDAKKLPMFANDS